MAKPEKEVKPNRGQDEILHEITSPDGVETTRVTQREWRERYRNAGWTRTDEETTTTALPVAE